MSKLRNFAYFGTPAVARDTLALLLAHNFVPELVVTSPDAPRGRGLVITPSETKALASETGLPVFAPAKLSNDAIEAIHACGCDYAIVVAYGKIFPEELIATFPLGIINVHYSLLPKYRGATPLETALLSGETKTGVTLQKMVREMDAGDILAQETTTIGPTETARELRPRLIRMGGELLIATLPKYLDNSITPTLQDASLATRARKLKKEDGLIDLTAPGSENWYKYRAYADTIGTYFIHAGKRIKITNAEFVRGTFRVLRVIPEGKSETAWKD